MPGGDDAVLVDRQNLVLWSDMKAISAANVARKGAPAVAAGEQPPNDEPMAPGQDDDGTAPDDVQDPDAKPPGPAKPARETVTIDALRAVRSRRTSGDCRRR